MKNNIKSLITLAGFLLTFSINGKAQVSINTDNAAPDPSAMLDIQSNNRGFLIPRMTENDRLTISSPANGLFLYQTDNDEGFYYNEGTSSMPEWAKVAIQTNNLICDTRIPIDSVFNGTNYEINQTGSYYFTDNITINTANLDGIIINADNVTLDLNGYTLDGNNVSDDGIRTIGDRTNIMIKNGIIDNWTGYGITAFGADQSYFFDLLTRDNGLDGIAAGYSCLIYRCVAEGNGDDGLYANTASIIANSTSHNNVGNGIWGTSGVLFINCTVYENRKDGINTFTGCRVENCNAYKNDLYGIETSSGGQVINCTASRNGWNGIDLSSSSFVMNSTASRNGQCLLDSDGCSSDYVDGAGIRVSANSQVINNTCNDNVMGIRLASTDSYMSDNHCEGNQHAGISTNSSGGLIIRNRAYNNGFDPIQVLIDNDRASGNIVIDSDSAHGPIIDVSSVGDFINAPGADHPYANFEY